MQDVPLTLPHLFGRAEQLFFDKELVTATATGLERTDYGTWAERTRRLGGVLDDLGISEHGRVATFAWNTARHLELYFAAPCSNRVLHTLNIRLFPEQLVYIANHAEDEVIFVDRSLLGLLWPLVDQMTTVRHIVVMDDGKGEVPSPDGGRALHDYEDLLAAASPVGLPRRRREPGRVDGLHERHHRQPEGRRLLAPLHVPAHPRLDGGQRDRRARRATGSCPSCRCSTPTPGASPTPPSPPGPRW